jgi:multiple sugar transport system substrate-binding protein
VAYAEFVASPRIQSTLYAYSGGQPGYRTAWLDADLNAASNNFFANTLATLDAAWVRPRFPGFIAFQDAASNLVHHYLAHGGAESEVLSKMNDALITTRKHSA